MKTTLALFLLSFVSHAAWSDGASIKGAAPFSVEIVVNVASLEKEFYKSRHVFFVDTKVTNVSHREQEIVTWTQYGWSWRSSSPEVAPGIEALQNVRVRIVLQPGQSYDRPVEMFSSALRPVTFRLGFVPITEGPISVLPNPAEYRAIFWSNPVTLTR